MGRKKKWKECVKPRTTTIDGTSIKVPSLLTCLGVEEVVDENGKKQVVIKVPNPYKELHNFLNTVEESLNGCNSDSEKEAIYRKYSEIADDHLALSLDPKVLNGLPPSPDHSYIDALKRKSYYRESKK